MHRLHDGNADTLMYMYSLDHCVLHISWASSVWLLCFGWFVLYVLGFGLFGHCGGGEIPFLSFFA